MGVGRSKEDIAESKISVENVGLSQFSITLDEFHPDIKNLNFIPAIVLGSFSVHYKVKQTSFKISKNNNESIKSSSTHDEIIDQLILVKGLV